MQHQYLADKVILVSGGAHRLGAAIVRAAAQQGMRVAFQYHQSQVAAQQLCHELRQGGHTVWAWQGDWQASDAPVAFAQAARTHYGAIDVVVNNAGVWKPTPIGQITDADWHELYQINVVAAFALIQACLIDLRERSGAVVNICDSGIYRPWSNYTPYLASKGAMRTMTVSLARELAPDVRVTGVAPGLVLPPDDWDAARLARAVAPIPLQRSGTAQDVAEAVLFLAAARYITGVVLPVDGGTTLRG
jgi:pteridine reductase